MLETIRLVLVQRALLLHMEMIKEIKLQYYNHKPSEYWKLADMFLFQKFSLILEYYLQLYYHLKCHRSQGRPLLPPSLAQFGCALSFFYEIYISYKAGSLGTTTPRGSFILLQKYSENVPSGSVRLELKALVSVWRARGKISPLIAELVFNDEYYRGGWGAR